MTNIITGNSVVESLIWFVLLPVMLTVTVFAVLLKIDCRRKRVLSPSEIQKIPKSKYTSITRIDNNENYDCPICWHAMTDEDEVRLFNYPCKHYYHLSCIDPWLTIQSSCPLCLRRPQNNEEIIDYILIIVGINLALLSHLIEIADFYVSTVLSENNSVFDFVKELLAV